MKARHSPLSAGLALVLAASAHAGDLDDLGFTALRAAHPDLTGAGQIVAQPEAGPPYQITPGANGYMGTIQYYDSAQPYGSPSTAFSSASGHANAVADHLFGATSGGAPGVQSVLNFDADYFYGSIVSRTTSQGWRPVSIAAPIVNQSFIFTGTDPGQIAQLDRSYDAYANRYGTLFINALNNGDGTLTNAPASMYNGIAVGDSDGAHSGRAQLVAPGGATSFATPYVTAAAVVLRQAAQAGNFQAITGAATDARVLKAGLLNGATKSADWTHTSTDPLDTASGAGLLNVANSYDTLAGGQHLRSATNLTSAGITSTTAAFTAPISATSGWDLASLNSSTSQDAVNHYFFDLSSQSPLTLTATLTWNSITSITAGTDLISNFDLVLVDTMAEDIVWSSESTTQNVEYIYLTGLAGSKYDLQVILRGGTGVPALSDSYALAWSWDSNGITAVPESSFAWLIGAAGFLFIIRKRLAARAG